jgi:hypothetical protein
MRSGSASDPDVRFHIARLPVTLFDLIARGDEARDFAR